MDVFVVSNAESRRTEYFIKAGKHLGMNTCFITYKELMLRLPFLQHAVVKLEPPVSGEADFCKGEMVASSYRQTLRELTEISLNESVSFLNTPQAILSALDKAGTKLQLQQHGIAVTPLLAVDVDCFDSLRQIATGHQQGIFLKPRYGSGAGGVMAMRYHAARQKWVAYTTMQADGDKVYNTKRILRLTDETAIAFLVKVVLSVGSVVETWIPKEQCGGRNYDLRLVCRDGAVDYIVVRCSNGAITNLHLNNDAQMFDELDLSTHLSEELTEQALLATRALELRYAGVDALVVRGTEASTIIEVNGQGDHIYQDMFAGNRIYINQLKSIQETNDR